MGCEQIKTVFKGGAAIRFVLAVGGFARKLAKIGLPEAV
jgi:hypothetical protein